MWLIALSALSALLTTDFYPVPARLAGIVLLILSFLKARLILLDYLALRHAPSWRRGFMLMTAGLLAALTVLFLAA
jgi:nitric oxide reductase NorF protein